MPYPTRRQTALLAPLLAPPLAWLLWPRRAAAEPDIALSDLMARLAAVPERRSAFRERRRFAALSEPLESIGQLVYRRPAHLEKITTWPQPERLVVDGDRLVLTPAYEPPRVVDLASQPELRVLIEAIRGPLSGDLGALQRAFAVRVTGGLSAWALDLAPLDPRAMRFLRHVRIAGAGAEIREVALVQANGDEQTILIGPAP